MLRSPDTRDDGRDPKFMQAPGETVARDSDGSMLKQGYSSPLGSPSLRLRPSGESPDPTSAPGRARIGAMGTYSEAAAKAHAEAVLAFRARLAARFDSSESGVLGSATAAGTGGSPKNAECRLGSVRGVGVGSIPTSRLICDGTAWAEPAPVARKVPPPIVVLALLASVATLVLAVVELFS